MKRAMVSVFLLAGCAGLISGCAGTAPTAEFRKAILDVNRLCNDDEASVKLTSVEGVKFTPDDRGRFESVIKSQIDESKKEVQCPVGVKRKFVLNANITKYDEGSKFARLMIAGAGAMHIDGDFALKMAENENENLAEFSVFKTFAWGGLYGASTSMKDIEPAFAKAVAEAIVGKK